jgi:hypothetical protein
MQASSPAPLLRQLHLFSSQRDDNKPIAFYHSILGIISWARNYYQSSFQHYGHVDFGAIYWKFFSCL